MFLLFLMIKTKKIFRLLLLITVIFISGCDFFNTPSPLRIGVSVWASFEFLFLAEQKGFFKDENLEVKLVEFTSLSDTRRAFERGQIDGLATTTVEVLYTYEQSDKSAQIIQIVDVSNGADVILAKPSITDLKQLRGTTVGLELASLGVYVLARGLETQNMTLSDVKTVSMEQVSLGEALTNQTVDAIVSYPPVSYTLQRDNKVNQLFSSTQIPNEVLDVLAIDAGVIKEKTPEIQKLLRAYHRAIRYAQENPEEAYAMMAEREKISPEELKQILTTELHIVTEDEQHTFFQENGTLFRVMDFTDKILRETHQIEKERRGNVINSFFVNH